MQNDPLESLLKWAKSFDIELNECCEIRWSTIRGGGRGVFVKQDENLLKSGEEDDEIAFVSIPERVLLSIKDEKENEKQRQVPLSDDDRLCFLLLEELAKGEKSFWSAYLQTLPEHLDLLELWQNEEINELQDTFTIARAETARNSLERSYDRVCRTHGKNIVEKKDWFFAKGIVRSRTVSVPWAKSSGALVPLGDFFNYHPILLDDNLDESEEEEKRKPVVGYGIFNEETQRFEFCGRGLKTCKQDSDEIFMHYGTYTNLELLELYGFSSGSLNMCDEVFLEVPLLKSSSYVAKIIAHSGKLCWESLRFLRLEFCIDKKKDKRQHYSGLAARGEALNTESEMRMCEAVRDAAATALLSFKTTARDDTDLLLEKKTLMLMRRLRLAVEYRLGVKRALQKTYKFYDEQKAHLLEEFHRRL